MPWETLQEEAAKGHQIYVTHTLPRRAGEMDLRIDDTPHQLYFRAILQSVSIRMASFFGNGSRRLIELEIPEDTSPEDIQKTLNIYFP